MADAIAPANISLNLVNGEFWTCVRSNTVNGESLESVRKHQAGLQSFRSMRRIEASRRNASALRLRFSQSFASLRQRLSQAKVRSTTQRRILYGFAPPKLAL